MCPTDTLDIMQELSSSRQACGEVLTPAALAEGMKIRGERRCNECGATWSYYETGSVECPGCGSIHSVGIDERTEQTDKPTDFDLSPARKMIDEQPLKDVASLAKSDAREYVRSRGFISRGEIRPLDERYVAAQELAYAAAEIERRYDLDENGDEAFYFLSLLRGADVGDRPPAEEVPHSMRFARGLAAAASVRIYRQDVLSWLADDSTPVCRILEMLGEHVKRIEALDGDVSPESADTLVFAARDAGTFVREDEEGALSRATDRLARLDVR